MHACRLKSRAVWICTQQGINQHGNHIHMQWSGGGVIVFLEEEDGDRLLMSISVQYLHVFIRIFVSERHNHVVTASYFLAVSQGKKKNLCTNTFFCLSYYQILRNKEHMMDFRSSKDFDVKIKMVSPINVQC